VISKVYEDPEEAGSLLYDITYDDGDTDGGLQGYFVRPRGKKRKLNAEFDAGTQPDGEEENGHPTQKKPRRHSMRTRSMPPPFEDDAPSDGV
jgi:hypothetical protein